MKFDAGCRLRNSPIPTERFVFLPGGDGTYHFKLLVPSVAAGAIIGKGGETIAQLQKETGARVKMSKSHDFYPGKCSIVLSLCCWLYTFISDASPAEIDIRRSYCAISAFSWHFIIRNGSGVSWEQHEVHIWVLIFRVPSTNSFLFGICRCKLLVSRRHILLLS